ncbi:hypothetical protein RUM44_002395 [Polyplax serrata]|uniref:Uncharacterized protein n=1 Tax=Polyplax serrata TaxID=468196 RepID=A0ABR1AER4_POLSC
MDDNEMTKKSNIGRRQQIREKEITGNRKCEAPFKLAEGGSRRRAKDKFLAVECPTRVIVMEPGGNWPGDGILLTTAETASSFPCALQLIFNAFES